MAGAATAVTNPAMHKMYRDMAGFRRKSQALRNAKRVYSRSLYESEDIELGPTAGSQRAGFPCFYLCGDCGYMAEKPSGACPSCNSKTWLDLGDVDTARMVREDETSIRMAIPKVIDRFLIGAFVVITMLTLIILQDPDWNLDMSGWFWVIAEAIVAVPLYFVLRRHMAKLYYKMRPRPPIRWRMPSRIPTRKKKPNRRILGKAVSLEILKAPFSGEPCIAYKASVLFDASGDARPPEWVLAEVQAVDCEIADTLVPGKHVIVDAKLEPAPSSALSSEELKKFLRARGLYQDDGEFTFFEALVKPSDRVEASFFDSMETVVLKTAG